MHQSREIADFDPFAISINDRTPRGINTNSVARTTTASRADFTLFIMDFPLETVVRCAWSSSGGATARGTKIISNASNVTPSKKNLLFNTFLTDSVTLEEIDIFLFICEVWFLGVVKNTNYKKNTKVI